ncbi:hypothetical protein [Rhizobium sp. AG855]|uniref:hypothetical protein n=1 Tax=Rhizobium sp. AG855 TaxID=2183898 RepID=UPI001FE06997|nr:hypothetical protein [Rhizobium sp. AG855]
MDKGLGIGANAKISDGLRANFDVGGFKNRTPRKFREQLFADQLHIVFPLDALGELNREMGHMVSFPGQKCPSFEQTACAAALSEQSIELRNIEFLVPYQRI